VSRSTYHLPPEKLLDAGGEEGRLYLEELHRIVFGEDHTQEGTLNKQNVVEIENLKTGEMDAGLTLQPDGNGGLEFDTTPGIDAQFLVLDFDPDLFNERKFVPGSSLAATDGGAKANYDLDTIQDIQTTASPTFVGLTLTGLLDGLVRVTTGILSGAALVDLANEVTGLLGLANGGTNADLSSVPAEDLVQMNAGGTAFEATGRSVGDLQTFTWYMGID